MPAVYFSSAPEEQDFMRRRFARAGVEPPIFDAITTLALLIHRHGFAAVVKTP